MHFPLVFFLSSHHPNPHFLIFSLNLSCFYQRPAETEEKGLIIQAQGLGYNRAEPEQNICLVDMQDTLFSPHVSSSFTLHSAGFVPGITGIWEVRHGYISEKRTQGLLWWDTAGTKQPNFPSQTVLLCALPHSAGYTVLKGCSWGILTYTQGEDANRDASPHNHWPAVGSDSEFLQCQSAAYNVENLFKVPPNTDPPYPFQ